MLPRQMVNDSRDENTGRFDQQFADEDFLTVIRDHDLPTTKEVADGVSCKYRTAYGRLGELEDKGRITSRQVGNSLVWSIATEEIDK